MVTPQNEYIRTEEDVSSILHHSNISQDTLENSVQVLYFSNETKPTILLELDNTLSESISMGQTLNFLGNNRDKLILCTQSKTYDVRCAENSNSMLIIPGLKFLDQDSAKTGSSLVRRDICSIHHSYLEVRRIKPDIGRIRILLEKRPYQGPELEPDSYSLNNHFYTTNDLLETVQISEEEALEVLKSIDALQVKGFWRTMSFEYHFRALSHLINLIDENSWRLSSIPITESLKVLKELLPDYIAEHIFSIYCEPTGDIEDDEQMFELNQRKVCRFLAVALLSHAEKFNLDDFMTAWRQGVPEGIEVNLDIIKDMVIVEKKFDSSESIFYFPEHNLSGNINERFKQLFEAKPMWNYEEIEPFLRKLSSEKQDVKAILTKYTRAVKKDNSIFYFSKYGK